MPQAVCDTSSEKAVVPGAFALPLLLALFYHPRPMEIPKPAPVVNPYMETANGCPSDGGLIIGGDINEFLHQDNDCH